MRSCSRSLAGVCATVRFRLGRRRRRRGDAVSSRSHIAAGRKREAGAQQRRRSQKAAARLLSAPCRTMRQIEPLRSRSDRSQP